VRRILIQTVLHNQQRYPTVGDYVEGHGYTIFSISDMSHAASEEAVALHELIEYFLCKHRGISMEAIDAFDIEFEKNRKPGDDSEPGHDPRAPYHREHVFAEKLERLFLEELGESWNAHDLRVLAL